MYAWAYFPPSYLTFRQISSCGFHMNQANVLVHKTEANKVNIVLHATMSLKPCMIL